MAIKNPNPYAPRTLYNAAYDQYRNLPTNLFSSPQWNAYASAILKALQPQQEIQQQLLRDQARIQGGSGSLAGGGFIDAFTKLLNQQQTQASNAITSSAPGYIQQLLNMISAPLAQKRAQQMTHQQIAHAGQAGGGFTDSLLSGLAGTLNAAGVGAGLKYGPQLWDYLFPTQNAGSAVSWNPYSLIDKYNLGIGNGLS